VLTELIARLDSSLRPLMVRLPSQLITKIYSHGRKPFLEHFIADIPNQVIPPTTLARVLWGIEFRSPIFNSAGMFKNGEGYEVVSLQGAGAYLAGTTTALPREGNIKQGIKHPFAPYPHSGSASNWMGLPNEGHTVVAKRLSRISKVKGCPVGASISSEPTQSGITALQGIVEGMNQYADAGIDFIELNESCPNVPHHASVHHADHNVEYDKATEYLDVELVRRLEYVAEKFIQKQTGKPVPIIVKLSCDTSEHQIPAIVELLSSLEFGGVNIGNTSTQYKKHSAVISPQDQKLYQYFTQTFSGGLSGRILKSDSMRLSELAVSSTEQRSNKHNEFYVIRTGGIETADDVQQSLNRGIALTQWYTGYFEAFAHSGHTLYKKLYSEMR
jgi:dihydroorotate dehydrogenase